MSTCSRCQKIFECGMVDGSDGPCWCTALPPLPAGALDDADNALCLCPDCLEARIGQQTAASSAAASQAGA